MGEPGQKKTLKERLEGKKQMIALWTTVLGLLSAQGIPAVVEALSDKPSHAQVQAMIAKQTTVLTQEQRNAVDAIKDLDKKISDLIDDNSEHRTVTGRLEGTVSLLRDVLRDCCTRRHVRERLDRKPEDLTMEASPKPVSVDAGVPDEADEVEYPEFLPGATMAKRPRGKKKKRKKPPIELLKKVPEFNMQQQLQIQMPED